MSNIKPQIIADAYIPYLRGLFEDVANITYLPPEEFTAGNVKNADALIIRTRCKCNRKLLEGSKVKFIATATIGFDHIDTAYCKEAGIEWRNAPGCNANSVANYIYQALQYALSHGIKAETIGIVGVGNVGNKVVKVAKALNLKVLENDPPRQKLENSDEFSSIEVLQHEADIISFHVPLTPETYHMCDAQFLSACKRNPLIINSARGEVCDNAVLEKASNPVIIDCWENEPNINTRLMDKALLSTPHIAGYSADGKANATYMAAKAVCEFFNLNIKLDVAPPPCDHEYDICDDDAALRKNPSKFEWLRNNYPLRRDKYQF